MSVLSVQAKGGRAGLPGSSCACTQASARWREALPTRPAAPWSPAAPAPGESSSPAQHASFLKNVLTCMGFRCQVCHQSSTLAGGL